MELIPPLLLLFDLSQSEARARLDRLVAESADLAIDSMGHTGKSGTTVIYSGLTFACDWNVAPMESANRRMVFSTIREEAIRTALGVSLHPHVEQGFRIPEIAKAFLALGARFAKQLGAISVVWQPASLQTDTDYFAETVESYASGGVFPVLPIVDFIFDDADQMLRSNGLGLFCGQEFELRADDMERQDMIRRAIRLSHDLATNGAVEDRQYVADIDADNVMQLCPSEDGRLLECRVKSATGQIVTLG